MKCEIHGCELEYEGENGFGDDIWTCPMCEDELDAQYESDGWDDDDPGVPLESGDNVVHFGLDDDDEL